MTVKVSVTPFCLHADGWSDHGTSITGKHLVVHNDGAYVDHNPAVIRDRRMKVNREQGHPWLTGAYTTDRKAWTGFYVTVETKKEDA